MNQIMKTWLHTHRIHVSVCGHMFTDKGDEGKVENPEECVITSCCQHDGVFFMVQRHRQHHSAAMNIWPRLHGGFALLFMGSSVKVGVTLRF